MCTILCECEATVNSRPLTYLSIDPSDLTPLMPNMFLQEIREIGTPDVDIVTEIDLREKNSHVRNLKVDLRKRFRSEYLGQIRENANKVQQGQVKIGDLVFIGCDDKKRLEWPLGKITDEFAGRDGNVRTYHLKTQ